MNEFLSSGLAIDLVLVVVALEIIAIFTIPRLRAFGFTPIDVLGQLLAGAMLLLAVRCALTQAPWPWTALFLAASFPAHLFDLSRRVRAKRRSTEDTSASVAPLK
jgi:hypothetical protein